VRARDNRPDGITLLQRRITPGTYRIETPVGVVEATLHPGGTENAYANRVSVRNIPAYRHLKQVPVEIDARTIHVTWLGRQLVFPGSRHGLEVSLKNLEALTDFAWRVRAAATRQGIRGTGGQEIDHVELFAGSHEADSKSFVLCPGKAYDRSPCGTGTSAKLACLYADGKLADVRFGDSKAWWAVFSKGGSRFRTVRLSRPLRGKPG